MVALERPGAGTGSGAMQLDPVQVQGAFQVPPQAMIDNLPPPYAGGQVATGGQLGLLGNRDVMDTPFNQMSYTAKKAQDQQAQTVRDVLIDDPSVRTDLSRRQRRRRHRSDIRGFQVRPRTTPIAALRHASTFSVMPELAERIEILKGPAARLNGMPPLTAIGGTINVVPKRAGEEPLTQVTAGYTSERPVRRPCRSRAVASDPEKQFGIRINGVYRAGQTPVEWTSDKRSLVNIGMDYRGEGFRLPADLGYQYQHIGGALPYLGISPGVQLPWAPRATKNFGEPWNYSERKDLFGVVRGEVDITENVTAYASFGAHDFRQAALSGGARLTMTNINGNVLSTPYNQSVYQQFLDRRSGLRARSRHRDHRSRVRLLRRWPSGARTVSARSTARRSPATSTIRTSSRSPTSRRRPPTRCRRWSRRASPSPTPLTGRRQAHPADGGCAPAAGEGRELRFRHRPADRRLRPERDHAGRRPDLHALAERDGLRQFHPGPAAGHRRRQHFQPTPDRSSRPTSRRSTRPA